MRCESTISTESCSGSRVRTRSMFGAPTITEAIVMLPTHRPPTHAGEMLLKEFLEPLGVSFSSPDPSNATRQLDFVFASKEPAERLRVQACNAALIGERVIMVEPSAQEVRVRRVSTGVTLTMQQLDHDDREGLSRSRCLGRADSR